MGLVFSSMQGSDELRQEIERAQSLEELAKLDTQTKNFRAQEGETQGQPQIMMMPQQGQPQMMPQMVGGPGLQPVDTDEKERNKKRKAAKKAKEGVVVDVWPQRRSWFSNKATTQRMKHSGAKVTNSVVVSSAIAAFPNLANTDDALDAEAEIRQYLLGKVRDTAIMAGHERNMGYVACMAALAYCEKMNIAGPLLQDAQEKVAMAAKELVEGSE